MEKLQGLGGEDLLAEYDIVATRHHPDEPARLELLRRLEVADAVEGRVPMTHALFARDLGQDIPELNPYAYTFHSGGGNGLEDDPLGDLERDLTASAAWP